MMKMKILLLLLAFTAFASAAQIKDVRFDCNAKGCQVVFAFASSQNLPTFFQKYDASSKKLTVGFSETSFALGEGNYDVDANSKFVKSMRVYKDAYKGVPFLKIEMDVGASINSDKNEIALDKSNFLIKLKSKGGKSWTLSKLFADRKKAADKLDKKAAAKAALEEKKAAQRAALEEKKRLAEEKKAAQRQALEDKKR